MNKTELKELLSRAHKGRVGLIGDLCLDMYWMADMTKSHLSRETPHHPLPVVEERYAPGGAGNVACNMAALNPGTLLCLGVVGQDWRGRLLLNALQERGISIDRIITDADRVTNTYIKPLRMGISQVVYEDPRLDFENYTPLSKQTEMQLLEQLDQASSEVDVLCVSDQMEFGCITPRIRRYLCALGKQGLPILVDSRSRGGEYTNVILKPNEVEAAAILGQPLDSLEDAHRLCKELSEKTGTDAVITLGDRGSMLCVSGATVHCPACPVEPPVDFCGAGDTFLSGLGVFLAAGASLQQAAQIATICSAITVKKLNTTGTATPEEIMATHKQYQ